MCLDIAKLVSEKTPGENANQGAKRFPLGEVEKKIAERILMELYCRGHDSQHYEVCPPRQSVRNKRELNSMFQSIKNSD